MNSPGANLIDSKGCRIELWELVDQSGSEHTQKPVNHFGMEVDDVAQVYEKAVAAAAKAEMPQPSEFCNYWRSTIRGGGEYCVCI